MPAPQRSTGQGQWALGHREPLNPNERFKKDDDGLNVRQRIENIYAYRGFDAIDPSDLRGRMRWWGLYTQRSPGIGGGLTGSLEPEELDDKFFMLRVRIDGGRLTSEQLRAIAEVSTEYGARHRRRHRPAEHPAALDPDRRHARRSGSGSRRPAFRPPKPAATPRASSSAARWPATMPTRSSTAQRRSRGRPRTATSAIRSSPTCRASSRPPISGCPDHCTVHEINDISFVGVVGPDGAPGFDLWVGGGLSTNPKLAVRLGVFVTEEQLPEVWAGVTSIFRDYGYRRSRNRARLKFLMADWGPEKFREVLEKEYLGYPLPDGPAPEQPRAKRRDHVGVTPLRDGTFAVGLRAARRPGVRSAARARSPSWPTVTARARSAPPPSRR